ncbi:ABC transporter permease [Chloroflexi bacterium TSY]|nr:ABC transporter permease [Chloroflexi bacterium TSY]
MTNYIFQRLVYMVLTFFMLSVVVFIIIQLPPGDYLDTYIVALQEQGGFADEAEVEALRKQFGLDGNVVEQYIRWLGKFLRGDMGRSFEWNQPVNKLLAERLPYTVMLSLITLFFTYVVAIPIGIYVATRQYSFGDYFFSVLGFVGLATPNFMLALILMFLFFRYFDISVGGLFSAEYALEPWSLGKVWDLFTHLWVPVIVIGTAGTAGIIRVMRGTLLDELGKQYVITARAKGVTEGKLLFRYPVRVAINPIVSTVGWQLPRIVSGETIVAIVLSLPTTGPLLFRALLSQDMFMAGSIVMFLGILTLIGTLLSDILLVIVDPRIRFESKS